VEGDVMWLHYHPSAAFKPSPIALIVAELRAPTS
jgi:hypothetical protein